MSSVRRPHGRLFQIRGPAAPKLQSPKLMCVRGTAHVRGRPRKDRRLPSEMRWISSARYVRIWPHNAWRTRQASLNLLLVRRKHQRYYWLERVYCFKMVLRQFAWNTIAMICLDSDLNADNDRSHYSGVPNKNQLDSTRVKWRSLESGEWTTLSGARRQATSSKLDRSCPKTWLSAENCTRREDGRKRTRRKPRRKMLDLLMEQEDKKISYQELKRRAENRIQWHHHQMNLP